MHAWEVVIERRGVSRFPIQEAKVQLAVAKRLSEEAVDAVLQEAEEDELYKEP